MNTRRKAAQPVQPSIASNREIVNASSSGTYSPTWQPLRPNADQHENVPSRQGDRRVYRDGRVEGA